MAPSMHNSRQSQQFAVTMIDASDQRLLDWIVTLPPRQELIVRTALRGHAKNVGRDWDTRIDMLMAQLKIDTTAKIAELLRDVQKQTCC
jgi:hypothetical protein